MRRIVYFTNAASMLLCAVILAATSAPAQDRPEAADKPNEAAAGLFRELLELRLEVYRQGIEFQEWKVRHLEDYLERARTELRRLEEEERMTMSELTEPGSETGEVGARRKDLSEHDLPRLRAQLRTMEHRIEEGAALLVKEQDRRSQLTERARHAAERLRQATGP
jgi:chromosome segregation ATPase